jgi:3-isopropylmalate/(R)-2-methylmalate dehydratase large subunit
MMKQTMTYKMLARASGQASVKAGDVILPKVEIVACLDTMSFIEAFDEKGYKVWDPARLVICFDHSFQPDWMFPAVKVHPKIRKFAKAQGVPAENLYDIGRNGISHHIPVEQGWALPGTVCLGMDTQSATMGAANCFAIPCFEIVPVLLTGDVWLQVPECVRVNLVGKLPAGVEAKDVVYRLLRDLSPHVNGKVMEFSGSGLAQLSLDARMTIANGSMQIGALTSVFPADRILHDYMANRARQSYQGVEADADAPYVAEFEYDLSSFETVIAGPHDITLIRGLSEVMGLEIQAANIGSCSSGRISDLALAAKILAGRKVHPGVRLIVTPISADTGRAAEAAGIYRTFLEAGATITTPGCGGCYSGNLSPLKLGDGERCLSTSVETIRGRMGSTESEVYLGNAAVAAASAIEGRIADPRKYL